MMRTGRSTAFAPPPFRTRSLRFVLGAFIATVLFLGSAPATWADLPPCSPKIFSSKFELGFYSLGTTGWSSQSPECLEAEFNGDQDFANVGCTAMRGSISTIGDLDYFQFTPVGSRYLMIFETYEATPGSCPTIDTVLTLTNNEFAVLGGDDDGGVNSCSQLVYVPYPANPVQLFLRVEEFGTNATIAQYGLTYTIESLFLNEEEPNDTLLTAEMMCDGYNGQIGGAGDVDYLWISMAAGSTLTAQTHSGFSSLCEGGTDTVLDLYDGGGFFITTDDDGGAGECSLLTYTHPTGGVVRLRVSEFQNNNSIDFYGLTLAYTP